MPGLRPTLSLALLSTCIAASPARADDSNTAQAGASPSFGGGSGPYNQTVTQPGFISIGGSAFGDSNSSGDAATQVDYGFGKGRGEGFGAFTSLSRAIFRDSVTITSPGVPTGTPGTLTYRLRVGGTLGSASGFSNATWQLQSDLGGGAYDIGKGGHFNSPELSPPGYSGDALGDYSATISFQFGFAMPLDAELTMTAGAGYSFNGPGEGHYDMSMYWEGISDVKANGSPVGSFEVAAQSGTDWSHARCPADINGDGFVDGIDYDTFNNLFEAGDPAADYNNDGFVDGIDYDQFNNDFETGC